MGPLRAVLALLAVLNVASGDRQVTFEGGDPGMLVDKSGMVIELSDSGQAENRGLGGLSLRIKTIDDEQYSEEVFDKYKNSGSQYVVTFENLEDDEDNPPEDECNGWDDGNCVTCLKFTTSMGALEAKCLTCKDGWAVIDGPPAVGGKYFNPDRQEFKWHGHCAEIDRDTEKRVIVIRHGLSTWNEIMESSGKVAGLVGPWFYHDAPLAGTGLRQVQRLAQVIRKANVAVYGNDAGPTEEVKSRRDYSLVEGARVELEKVSLEEAVKVKMSDTIITDEAMVQNLTKPENRLELDILLGRKCDETAWVGSNLVRAIDTLLLGTVERKLRCVTPWEMSSNLQELEHNADCTPTTAAGTQPIMQKHHRKEYLGLHIGKTADLVASMYKEADATRHTIIRGATERMRWNEKANIEVMKDELQTTMSSQMKYRVWAGHSIWFRHLFRRFSDQSNTECRRMGKIKMANTGMISFRLRRLKSSPREFVADDCKFIHLHSDKIFKIKAGKEEL